MLVITTGQQAQTGTVQQDHEVWSFPWVGVLKITEGKLDGRWPSLTERWTRAGTAILFPHRCFLEGRAGRDVITPLRGSPVPEGTAPGGMNGPGKDSSHPSPTVGKAPGEHARGWAHRVHGSGLERLCAKFPGSAGRAAHLPPEPCQLLARVTAAPPGGSKTPPSTSPCSCCSLFPIPATRGRGQQVSVAESQGAAQAPPGDFRPLLVQGANRAQPSRRATTCVPPNSQPRAG